MSLAMATFAGCSAAAPTPTVLATPGVGGSATPSKNTEPRNLGDDPFAAPDTNGRVIYADGLVSDPIIGSTAGLIDLNAALKSSAANTFGDDLQPGTPIGVLRTVTIGSTDSKPRPGWVLTWRNSRPDVKGPITLPSSERRTLQANSECVFVEVVDASSAEVIDARQFCRPT